MLPKSIQKIFVRFDEGAHTIKYYNKDTCKVLTSQNYQFIDPTNTLIVHLDTTYRPVQLPGEDSAERMKYLELCTSEQLIRSSPSKKRSADENGNSNLRKTQGVCLDFKRLADPFLDEEENEDTSMITVQIILDNESYLATISDASNTLKEAKNSDD